jgi:hypothetical protein
LENTVSLGNNISRYAWLYVPGFRSEIEADNLRRALLRVFDGFSDERVVQSNLSSPQALVYQYSISQSLLED